MRLSNVVELSRSENPKEDILKAIGDISGLKVIRDEIIVATYVTPEKTKGNIILPGKTVEESRYQSKVGLVIAMGPTAFKYERIIDKDGQPKLVYLDFPEPSPKLGDWVGYQPHDGREMFIQDVTCRIMPADCIKMVLDDPEMIF